MRHKKFLMILSIITLVNVSTPYQTFAEVKDNVGGMDTTGTASADEILDGETAWANGELITGTMPNRAATNIPIAGGGTYDIAKGYYNGSGKVLNDISSIIGSVNTLNSKVNDTFELTGSAALATTYANNSTYTDLSGAIDETTSAIENNNLSKEPIISAIKRYTGNNTVVTHCDLDVSDYKYVSYAAYLTSIAGSCTTHFRIIADGVTIVDISGTTQDAVSAMQMSGVACSVQSGTVDISSYSNLQIQTYGDKGTASAVGSFVIS